MGVSVGVGVCGCELWVGVRGRMCTGASVGARVRACACVVHAHACGRAVCMCTASPMYVTEGLEREHEYPVRAKQLHDFKCADETRDHKQLTLRFSVCKAITRFQMHASEPTHASQTTHIAVQCV